jgi:hypothetical protein
MSTSNCLQLSPTYDKCASYHLQIGRLLIRELKTHKLAPGACLLSDEKESLSRKGI